MKRYYDFTTSAVLRKVKSGSLIAILLSLVLIAGIYFVYGFSSQTKELAKYGFLYETSETNENEVYITGVIKDENSEDGEILSFPTELLGKTVIGLRPLTSEGFFYIDDEIYRQRITDIKIPSTYLHIHDRTLELFSNVTNLDVEYSNVSISSGALSDLKNIKSIKLPLNSAGGRLVNIFGGDLPTSLKTINLCEEETKIPDEFFENCYNIENVVLPNNISSIGRDAFYGCINLKSINLTENITEIGTSAFKICTSLEEITIPGSITNISSDCFQDCINLKKIVINEGIVTIKTSAFTNCSSLSELKLPSSLKNIDSSAFSNCVKLSKISFNDGLEYIGNSAFLNCNKLSDITLPDSLLTIEEYAFSYCNGISEIVIPDSITEISENTFEKCENLEKITLGKNVKKINTAAFYECYKLKTIFFNDKLEQICYKAFDGCNSITNLNLPDSLISLEEGALSGLSQLKILSIPFIGSGVTNSTAKYELFGYIFGSENYKNGLMVTQKYANSFYSFYIPSTLKTVNVYDPSINSYAFFGCNNITKVNLYNTVSIGTYAFSTSGIEKISVPEGTTTISSYAFYDCDDLTDVTLPKTVSTVSDYAFSNCKILSTIILPDSLLTIESSMFADCPKLYNVKFGNKTSVIKKDAFLNCVNLKTIVLPNTITEIHDSAFNNCKGLTSVVFSENLKSIGVKAFENCTNLESVEFNNKLQTISANAFTNCTKLKSIDLPSSLNLVDEYAFQGCTSLSSVNIQSGVKKIASYAFSNCINLTSIQIPSSVTTLGSNVFNGTNELKVYCEVNSKPSGWSSLWSTGVSHAYWGISEDSYYKDNNFEYIVMGSEAVVTEYFGTGTTVTIPNSITISGIKYNVKSIDEGVFFGKSNIKQINLSSNLTKIGNNAFKDCTGLTEIIIPSSVTSIGENILSGCNNLTEITIPFIGATKSITLNTIPSQKTLFGYLFGTSSFTGSMSVKQSYNESSSIEYCIPQVLEVVNVTGGFILYGAFDGCSNIKEINIHSGCTKISENSFRNCKSLSTFNFPISLTEIDANAFSGCSSLTTISMYQYMKKVGEAAFKNCTSLKTAKLPKSITYLGANIFEGCKSLVDLTLPFIDDVAASSNHNPITLGYYFGQNSYAGASKVYQYYNDYNSKTYYIPDSLKSVTVLGGYVNYGAFWDCYNLISIAFDTSVVKYEQYALYGCSSLTTLTLPYLSETKDIVTTASERTLLGYIFGTLSYNGSNAVKQYYNASTSKTFYIPSKLEKVTILSGNILYGAFSNCNSLKNVEISGNCQIIGEEAFKNCGSLKSIFLNDSLTKIEKNAFVNCTYLEKLTIPDSVTFIGESILAGCSVINSLTTPFIGSSKTDGASANSVLGYFFGSNSFGTAVATTQEYSAGQTVKYYIPSSLKIITVTGGNINYGTFSNCINIMKVSIETNVNYVGANAFKGTNVTNIYCAATSKPANWDNAWSEGVSTEKIIWGS